VRVPGVIHGLRSTSTGSRRSQQRRVTGRQSLHRLSDFRPAAASPGPSGRDCRAANPPRGEQILQPQTSVTTTRSARLACRSASSSAPAPDRHPRLTRSGSNSVITGPYIVGAASCPSWHRSVPNMHRSRPRISVRSGSRRCCVEQIHVRDSALCRVACRTARRRGRAARVRARRRHTSPSRSRWRSLDRELRVRSCRLPTSAAATSKMRPVVRRCHSAGEMEDLSRSGVGLRWDDEHVDVFVIRESNSVSSNGSWPRRPEGARLALQLHPARTAAQNGTLYETRSTSRQAVHNTSSRAAVRPGDHAIRGHQRRRRTHLGDGWRK